MYDIIKATPPKNVTRNSDPDFNESIAVLGVGEAFSFPVNALLKNPLEPAKSRARENAPTGARYRWVLDANTGTGTVYRTK